MQDNRNISVAMARLGFLLFENHGKGIPFQTFDRLLKFADQGATPGDSTVLKPRCSMPESGLVAMRAEIL